MGPYKVVLSEDMVRKRFIRWLIENVGKPDEDWTITHDLVDEKTRNTGILTHIHFTRQEDAVRFTLTWL